VRDSRAETLWTHIHCLAVLKEQGSFTAAARRLGVSKAAMTHRIAELERAMGMPLVKRTTRSMSLTEAGEALAAQVRGPFESISQSFADVRDLAGEPRGLLRVTAPVAFARQHLVHRLPDFLRQYPQVRIELDMSDQIRSLQNEGFDLAIRHTSTPPETHVAWTLARTGSVLVASKSYARKRGLPATPAELAAHACLHYPRRQGAATWTFLPRTRRTSGRTPREADPLTVPITGQFAANNSEALRDAAIGGLGIALLPDFSAQAALDSGKLVEVLPGWEATGVFGDALFAVRPYAAHVPMATKVLVEFLRSAFSGGFREVQ
jgi:DNA-binding transcriptional LysR family regulator